MVEYADIMTIQGNWPRHYCIEPKTFDAYEARAVENLIGTIIDLVQDGETSEAVRGLRELAVRFDSRKSAEQQATEKLQRRRR